MAAKNRVTLALVRKGGGGLGVGSPVALWAALGLAATGVVGVAAIAGASPAQAQGRCSDLWHQRNEIYARNGYCFRTARARAAFGPGCFPPYGRLSGWEKNRVAEIQGEEDYLGCPR